MENSTSKGRSFKQLKALSKKRPAGGEGGKSQLEDAKMSESDIPTVNKDV